MVEIGLETACKRFTFYEIQFEMEEEEKKRTQQKQNLKREDVS